MRVLYPGSFNPWHNGHQYVYDEACEIFGKENVYIGIATNPDKDSKDEQFVKWCLNSVTKNIVIINQLVAEYCQENKFERIIRGIRQGYDLEQEEKLTYWNNRLGGIKTVYIPTSPELNQISSSVIRTFRSYKDFDFLKQYVPRYVCGRWFYNEEIPKLTIYYGHSCVGKSTYLYDIEKHWPVVNCDNRIWDCAIIDKPTISKAIRNAIEFVDDGNYLTILENIAVNTNWEKFFECVNDYDFPVIGNYFYYIPNEIKYKFKYIKLTTSSAKRMERIHKRGLTNEWAVKLDHFYQDPPFCDEEIKV